MLGDGWELAFKRHFQRFLHEGNEVQVSARGYSCLLTTNVALITILTIAQAIPDHLLRLHP